MLTATRISRTIRRAGVRRGRLPRIPALAAAGFVLVTALGVQGAAHAATARDSTARIQALLDNPVNGVVNLPQGTFTIRPMLRLKQAETIIGHHTTLKVAAHSGNYAAVVAGASPGTDLSGLTIKGVTFDQNAAGNPIANVQALYRGQPRFVILAVRGAGITITRNSFLHTNNVDTVVTGSATSQVTISGNSFAGFNAPMHDHSTIYTSGTGTTISSNTFAGNAMYDSAAIEVHGDQVSVTGNKITGYFRAANIVSNDTTFSRNTVTGAGNPVDLWSVVAPGLHGVAVTGNVLNRDLPYWARVLAQRGLPMRPEQETRQVIKDATSTFPMSQITIRGNRG